MSARKLLILTALTGAASAAPPAQAAPATVSVRIEGASQTLFEGPVATEPRPIRAASDSASRSCDATTGASGGPRVTPTVAAADAVGSIGEDFDGRWYADFGDYLIKRWGPQAQAGGKYWTLAVDGEVAERGGCQIGLGSGAGVLWAFGASASTPYLRLSAAADDSPAPGPAKPTATADVGQGLALRVQQSTGSQDPEPADSVTVAPVATTTDGKGYQTPLPSDPEAVRTNPDGSATIVFETPGWHRIKATASGFVRSNRLDVCVRNAEQGCGPPPPDTLVRTYRPGPAPGSPAIGGTPTDSSGETGTLRISRPRLNGRGARRGLIGVSWTVLEQGPGLRSWSILSRVAGARGPFSQRATGQRASSALVRLRPGRLHDLRYAATDARGHTSSARFARVVVPIDDRSRALAYRGYWGRLGSGEAWQGTVSRGGQTSYVEVRLGPGRPVFSLRATGRGPARVQVRTGGRARSVRVAGPRGSAHLARGLRRARGGLVRLSVQRGVVDLDGVALGP